MAKKIHTRQKRKLRMHGIRGRNRKPKPKTFKTEDSANAWALEHGLKPEQYYLKKVKRNKKFQIVMYNGTDKNTANKENNA